MLERIVRPFQTSVVNPGARIPIGVITTTVPAPTIIEWGEPGSLPEPQSDVASVKLEKDNENYKETRRKERTIRIENPDDPSQYVMVKRPEALSLDKKKKRPPEDTLKTPGSPGPVQEVSTSSGTSADGSQQAYNNFWKDSEPEDLLLWGKGYLVSKVEMYFRGGEPPNETNPDWPPGP